MEPTYPCALSTEQTQKQNQVTATRKLDGGFIVALDTSGPKQEFI